MKVLVKGAGVAGTMLGYLLQSMSNRGVHTVVEDPWLSKYDKPCGEAIPVSVYNKIPIVVRDEVIIERIRRVRIGLIKNGELVADRIFSYPSTMGFIIDKKRYIQLMRLLIRKLLMKHYDGDQPDLIVDARGPFSDSEEYDRLVVIRGFTDDYDGYRNEIALYFTDKFLGYLWVFPSSDRRLGRWNIGIGLRAEEYSRLGVSLENLLAEYARTVGVTEITNTKSMKIKIAKPKPVVGRGLVRIGEAGGFIVPYTGEGIRPAIESAHALANDIAVWRGEKFQSLVKLAKQYRKHHKVYKAVLRLGPERAAKALMSMEPQELVDLMEGRITFATLVKLYLRSKKIRHLS